MKSQARKKAAVVAEFLFFSTRITESDKSSATIRVKREINSLADFTVVGEYKMKEVALNTVERRLNDGEVLL